MKLSERLMKLAEEKARLECENMRLREDCLKWEAAYENCHKREEENRIRATDLYLENMDLRDYNRMAKHVFKKCGIYIVDNNDFFAIPDTFIKELNLECCNTIHKEVESNNILDLFKQSSKGI